MDYDPDTADHGLPHNPLKALVTPRPIGWISTVDGNGVVNLAPYSFFNLLSEQPAYVMFSSGGRKDSLRNAESTGEFVCNMATEDLFEEMLASSAAFPAGQSEPEHLGIEMRPSRKVSPPAVAAAHATLECVHHQTIELPGSGYHMVLGRVVHVHIDDAALHDGMVHSAALRPVSRLGYLDYSVTDRTFARTRPPAPE
jgi:flavin reductase (DIM6/NTAB) family NADH-FMN oxidoreductase RutF